MGDCLSRDRSTDDDDTTLFPIDDDVELVPLCRNYGRTDSTLIVCTGFVENSADLRTRADSVPLVENGDFWLAHVHHACFCTDDKELVRAALWGLSRWHRRHARLSRYPF